MSRKNVLSGVRGAIRFIKDGKGRYGLFAL